jgi:hypothetical protein
MWMRPVSICCSAMLLMASALWLAPMSAGAKPWEFTGDDYLHRCTTPDPKWKPSTREEQDDAVFCVGYIEGAITVIVQMDGRGFCLPKDASPQDLLKATLSFMQAHPEQKQYLFASVMLVAAIAQWPCRK